MQQKVTGADGRTDKKDQAFLIIKICISNKYILTYLLIGATCYDSSNKYLYY